MMKSAALLTLAAYAGATSLRGEFEGVGVEEVGEQIEHFPPDDYGMFVERRILIEDESMGEDMMANRLMEEYFEEEEFDDEDFADVMIMGNVVEGETEEDFAYFYEDDEEGPLPLSKDYARHPDSITLEGNSLLGEEGVGEYDHSERHLASCSETQSDVKIILRTDKYAYETSWKIVKANGGTIASGPPTGTNYADDSTYTGQWCLSPGSYNIVVNDAGRDGMCTGNTATYGCGYFKVYLNGQSAGQVTSDKSRWQSKQFQVNVAPVSSRIDGVGNGNGNSQQWCQKVRSVMKVPPGTCTLPSGARGHRVRVTTKVDKYGKETSWTIKRNGGTKMKIGPIIEPNQQKSVEDCLPAGKYTLKVTDPDGICCRHGEGFFKLMVNGKQLLDGGSFVKEISHDFQLGFDWIASMNERDCEWWWAHDYRRRDWHTRCYAGMYCNKSYRHLKWSPELKADAKIYAEKLLNTCDDNTIKHDATEQGENLAKNKGSGNWGGLYSADKVTKRFMDNEEFWGWNRNAHLTQAAWRASRYIGCAESSKSMGGNKMCRMQVCRYAKAGNCMMGKYNAATGKNWMVPMMMDDTPCGPMCPSGGCHH